MSIFCRCWRKVPPPKISVVGSAATSTVDDPITPSLEEVGTAVSGLKHAATQFSHVFQQGVCRVVHIHGKEVLFSCFDLGNGHVLAFYSEKLTQSVLDTQEADRGVEKATAELRTILSPSKVV